MLYDFVWALAACVEVYSQGVPEKATTGDGRVDFLRTLYARPCTVLTFSTDTFPICVYNESSLLPIADHKSHCKRRNTLPFVLFYLFTTKK